MDNTNISTNSLIWESGDIEESFENRQYSYIRDILCVLDESKYNKIFIYEKDDTKLGYDVYLRYDRIDDYVMISFLTSFMIPDDRVLCEYDNDSATCADFCEMVRYSIFVKNFHQNKKLQAESIREKSGRILDNFFIYLLPEEYHNDYKIDNEDHDPLDGVVDFEKHHSYLNGGFQYFSPTKNVCIYDIYDENNKTDSLNLFSGNMIGYENDKVKNLISKISDLLINNISENDTNIYNGLKFFTNIFFRDKKDIWFLYDNFKFKKVYKNKKYNNLYERFEHQTVIQYKNIKTKEIGEINFGYQQHSGDLFDNPTSDQVIHVIQTYMNITDSYLQYFLFINFVNNHIQNKNEIVNKETYDFLNIIIEYKYPEKYIDEIGIILSDTSDQMGLNLFLYISFSSIVYKKSCYMYSEILYDIIPYFLNLFVNKSADEEICKILLNPFNNIDFDESSVSQLSNHNFSTEYAIKILYMYKIIHEKYSSNILLSQILDLAKTFKKTYSKDNENFDLNDYYKNQEILMLSVLISKLDNSSIENRGVIFDNISNICRLYIPGYRPYKSDCIYNDKKYTIPASKYDINLIIIFNMLINQMVKEPLKQSKIIKIIKIINFLAGSKYELIYKTYSGSMKIFSFFMLNSDRLDENLLDRFYIFINRLELKYQYGVSYIGSIKKIIIFTMMPLLWQQKLIDANFDDLDDIADEFITEYCDRNNYGIVYNKLHEYLSYVISDDTILPPYPLPAPPVPTETPFYLKQPVVPTRDVGDNNFIPKNATQFHIFERFYNQ